jgi:hypothetical protein
LDPENSPSDVRSRRCVDGVPDRAPDRAVRSFASGHRGHLRRRWGQSDRDHIPRALDDHLLPERQPKTLCNWFYPKFRQPNLQIDRNHGLLDEKDTSDFQYRLMSFPTGKRNTDKRDVKDWQLTGHYLRRINFGDAYERRELSFETGEAMSRFGEDRDCAGGYRTALNLGN